MKQRSFNKFKINNMKTFLFAVFFLSLFTFTGFTNDAQARESRTVREPRMPREVNLFREPRLPRFINF